MKTTKKFLSLLLVLLISMFSVGCGQTKTKQNTSQNDLTNLKIHYIDVGQADSELIQIDGKNILIDAGCNDNKALNYLKSIGVKNLDYVIATHPHEDHIGGMATIINNFNIGEFYAPKVTHTTKTFEKMIKALQSKGAKITAPTVGDTLNIGNSTLQFLAPNSSKYEDLNNYSIATRLKYGNKSFVFTGDAEALSENEILSKQLDISGDVLKLGHHGSHSSTSQAFLDKVNPKYAIISCGKDNDYGHPHKETMDKLNAKNINVFRTDLEGTIIATSNGNDITFNVSPLNNKSNISGSKEKSTISKNNNDLTTNEPVQEEKIVYWTKGGKSYHYDKNCKSLAKSKEVLEGFASSCPKTDPCNNCVK
ncbi:ComEC/Rec2 family competence protein [Clostridium weizhouense]|uniref:MBL fold metallo-hydrolase n=1 Tax=Clostridium weizhouense TaxID=2859781 RepID=A0ABS7ALU2_9CLOT|nr:ComEC/Rec2 family competence protein [Clostridium weizhouense]MBW6409376.1 MBL fold metallo-hydrolase [Clostridium weizhouense]